MNAANTLKRPVKAIIGDTLYHSENYISNGHWIVRRDRLTPKALELAARLALRREMPDASMAKVIPADGMAWEVTGDVRPAIVTGYAMRPEVVMLYSRDVAEFAAIDKRYADWLGLKAGDVLTAPDARTAFRTAAGDAVMGVRLD
jgi:hypothetical protein